MIGHIESFSGYVLSRLLGKAPAQTLYSNGDSTIKRPSMEIHEEILRRLCIYT